MRVIMLHLLIKVLSIKFSYFDQTVEIFSSPYQSLTPTQFLWVNTRPLSLHHEYGLIPQYLFFMSYNLPRVSQGNSYLPSIRQDYFIFLDSHMIYTFVFETRGIRCVFLTNLEVIYVLSYQFVVIYFIKFTVMQTQFLL